MFEAFTCKQVAYVDLEDEEFNENESDLSDTTWKKRGRTGRILKKENWSTTLHSNFIANA